MMSLAATLAAIRRVESGSFEGNYQLEGRRERGGTPMGAYGILDTNWRTWASSAGIPAADIRSQSAQDQVAAYVMQAFYNRYGSWELAAAAWYGGVKSADAIASRGGTITNPKIARFVKDVAAYSRDKQADIPRRPYAAARRAAHRESSDGWVFPVAGANEWSGGSYMAQHTKHSGSHYAIDIYAQTGTPIVAPVAGRITKIRSGGEKGGNTVTVVGNDGVTYYFAHMDKHAKGISEGQRIMAGHHLGSVGRTGSARRTSPHLHFSMKRNGKPINPKSYLSGAETSSQIHGDLEYVEGQVPEFQTAEASAIDAVVSAPPFGSSPMEAFISAAANSVAGGERADARLWEDPTTGIERDVEPLELETT